MQGPRTVPGRRRALRLVRRSAEPIARRRRPGPDATGSHRAPARPTAVRPPAVARPPRICAHGHVAEDHRRDAEAPSRDRLSAHQAPPIAFPLVADQPAGTAWSRHHGAARQSAAARGPCDRPATSTVELRHRSRLIGPLVRPLALRSEQARRRPRPSDEAHRPRSRVRMEPHRRLRPDGRGQRDRICDTTDPSTEAAATAAAVPGSVPDPAMRQGEHAEGRPPRSTG